MPTTENFSEISSRQDAGNSSYHLEMGLLLTAGGNFKKSLPHLQKAMQALLEKKDLTGYLSCYQILIQALNELMDTDTARQIHKEVKKVCHSHNISMSPMALTCSAYYSIYIEKNFDRAKKLLNSSLKIAFDKHDKYIKDGNRLKQNPIRYDIMVCLYVYSIYYFETQDYKNCIQELENLKILVRDYLKLKEEVELDNARTDNVQELQTYHHILEDLKKSFPNLQRMQLGLKYISALVEAKYAKKYKSADKLLWELYEEANKTNNTFLVPYILCSMAWCYIKMDNDKQAQMVFNLAKKNINKERRLLVRYMEDLEKGLKWNQMEGEDAYDLVFDIKDHLIVEKHKGRIELKNQFILMDLLKMFLLNPGVPYSKEKIIKKIWKQDYLPEIHDNKIYVTIKRLREMIEIDSCKPFYICRNNAGYHFSKRAKVLIKQ